MVVGTLEHESNSYSIVTKYLELRDGALGPLSQFSAVLGPLVTIGRPVTVGGSEEGQGLRRTSSNSLAVLSVSLIDGGTPSGPRIPGGARGRESRKSRKRDIAD